MSADKYPSVNFCKDRRYKTEVPDPLAVEDLVSFKLNNRRKLARQLTQYKLARLITQYRNTV